MEPLRPAPDQLLLKALARLSPQEAHNRLMRISNRELAIALLYLEKGDRESVIRRLSPGKEEKVRQELSYVEKLNLRYPHYRVVIESVFRRISGEREVSIRSYIRPRGTGKEETGGRW